MMTVKIITDSAADLPIEIIEKYDIDYLPLLVLLDEKEYKDGETIKPKELFDGMREGKTYKTAQIPAGVFKNKFSEYAEEGQEYIYIAFSSELSGTYQTAKLMKNQLNDQYPDFNLEIIDSKCASLGFGLVVLKAAQLAQEGKSKEEIMEAIHFYKDHMEHIFTVDDLEYLFRGGRVSKTAAFIGSLLRIKPLLHVEDGKLIPLEKIRGKKRVYKRMVELMDERGSDFKEQTIGISHGDDLKAANKLKDMIIDKFDLSPEQFVIHSIGGAVGAHAGPGTLALFFLDEKPEQ